MKGIGITLALLATVGWTMHAYAAEYPILEEQDLYVGAAAVFFAGDDPSGNSTDDSLAGIQLNGLLEEASWQAYWARSWDEDAMLVGGSLDFYLAHNFDDYSDASCGGCPPDYLWWFGIGPTLLSHREILPDNTGRAVQGEELGLNVGGGYHWEDYALSALVHYFPDSENTMISVGITHTY